MDLAEIERHVEAAAQLLKAASNPQRLLILCHLSQGERSVGELELLVGMRQAHLSQQLARLRQEALVRTRRDSRTIFYSLASGEAQRLIGLLYELYCSGGGAPADRPRAVRAAGGAVPQRPRPAAPAERIRAARTAPPRTADRGPRSTRGAAAPARQPAKTAGARRTTK